MRNDGRVRWLLVVLLVGCDCSSETPTVTPPQAPQPPPAEVEWLKGQLHMHTEFSGDSETPLQEALDWYANADFDFVVVTDHNHVTVGEHRNMLVLPGAELTQNLRRCLPAPEVGNHCALHVNALVVDPRREGFVRMQRFGIPSREDVFADSMQVATQLGGIAQLNHPNYRYAADADLLAALAGRGLRLFEMANEAVDSNNEGNEGTPHPSTEELWDDVLSRGVRLWATATDDSHHYSDADAVRAAGRIAHVGNLGWVVVRAARHPAAIRSALREGDFYASNGVELNTLETTEALRVTTHDEHRFEFIGRGGETLRTERGTEATFELSDVPSGGYVRAVVTNDAGKRAWTQPVFAP